MLSSVTPEIKEAMLEMLEALPNITAVRKLFGISESSLSRARAKDSNFNEAMKEAKSAGYDMMEAEAIRRAIDGWDEPVFYQGCEMGKVRKYSDKLLQFLLIHCKPKKFNPGAKISIGEGEKISFVFNVGKGNVEEE